jgi:glucose/arabinose dehydrogenase
MKHSCVHIILALGLITSSASGQLVPKKVNTPAKFLPIYDSARTVSIDPNFEIGVFAAGGSFVRPRFMAIGPHNTLYIADMNAHKIFALPDNDHNGVADTAIAVTPPVDTAHSIAFYHDTLYVAEPSRIRKFVDADGDGYYEKELPFIIGIGASGVYNHYTRTIAIDTIGKYMYVSVGASCNACREQDSERGTILRFNLDGSGRMIYASGLRNALGLAVSRFDGLWATNADRDGLGNELPPEIVTPIHAGAFYGWPFAYAKGKWVDFQANGEYQQLLPITARDTARVRNMEDGLFHLPAHSTPMAILFSRDRGVLVAVHGSSAGGRTVGLGYKVVQLGSDSLGGQLRTFDFLTGFLTDSINYKYWGRPCGLVEDTSGSIYLSSDVGIPAIYKITPKSSGAAGAAPRTSFSFTIYPNPSLERGMATIALTLSKETTVTVVVRDVLGVERKRITTRANSGNHAIPLQLENAANGTYFIEVKCDGASEVRKFVVESGR